MRDITHFKYISEFAQRGALVDMSHSYVKHYWFICETWLRYDGDMTGFRFLSTSVQRDRAVGHDSFLCATWLIRMFDVTHSYARHTFVYMWDMTHLTYPSTSAQRGAAVWYVSFVCEAWIIPHARHDLFIRETGCISNARHNSFLRETWLIPTWDMMHSKCKTWLIPMWDISRFKSETSDMTRLTYLSTSMSDSCVRHYLFICETWQRHDWDMTDFWYLSTSAQRGCAVWHDSFLCVTWLIHMCDVTHSHVRQETFIIETWHISHTSARPCSVAALCDMTQSYVRHDLFLCVTWLNPMCDMTHSYVWHDPFICVTWLICETRNLEEDTGGCPCRGSSKERWDSWKRM